MWKNCVIVFLMMTPGLVYLLINNFMPLIDIAGFQGTRFKLEEHLCKSLVRI